MIGRAICFLRGHYAHPECPCECPCERCGQYLSYEDLAVRRLHRSLPERLRLAWRDFAERRRWRRKWRSKTICAECGKRRAGCDDCIPF